MKIQPKQTRFKKFPKGKSLHKINIGFKNNTVLTSQIGIKAITPCRLSGIQILNLYNHLNKVLKKAGIIFIKVFPHFPSTKRSSGIRMGKGKGPIYSWICQIRPGTIICEIETNNLPKALKAIKYTRIRLPIKTKIIFT